MTSAHSPAKNVELTPDLALRAYAAGIFPMAEGRGELDVFWVDPDMRGLIPLNDFHVPKRLKKIVRQGIFEIRYDTAFELVIRACAEKREDNGDTWINEKIINLYLELYQLDHAHSVECWRNGRLVGGLYGISLGAAFFGESMFSRETNASKVALVYLIARMHMGGYRLLDTQFVTDHLKQFGAIEITRQNYRALLDDALSNDAIFYREVSPEKEEGILSAILQSTTQTS